MTRLQISTCWKTSLTAAFLKSFSGPPSVTRSPLKMSLVQLHIMLCGLFMWRSLRHTSDWHEFGVAPQMQWTFWHETAPMASSNDFVSFKLNYFSASSLEAQLSAWHCFKRQPFITTRVAVTNRNNTALFQGPTQQSWHWWKFADGSKDQSCMCARRFNSNRIRFLKHVFSTILMRICAAQNNWPTRSHGIRPWEYVMKVHAAEKKGMRKIIDSKMDLIVFTKLCDMKIIQSFVGRTLFSINGPELWDTHNIT